MDVRYCRSNSFGNLSTMTLFYLCVLWRYIWYIIHDAVSKTLFLKRKCSYNPCPIKRGYRIVPGNGVYVIVDDFPFFFSVSFVKYHYRTAVYWCFSSIIMTTMYAILFKVLFILTNYECKNMNKIKKSKERLNETIKKNH